MITEEEYVAREVAAEAAGEGNFYTMRLPGGVLLDARHQGSLARFINSSCDPNAEVQKWQLASTGAFPSSPCVLTSTIIFAYSKRLQRAQVSFIFATADHLQNMIGFKKLLKQAMHGI